MRSSTRILLFKQVFEQIVKDEALHGRLGFLYLEWADEFLDEEERSRLAYCAGDTLLQLSQLWRNLKSRVVGDRTSEGYKIEDIHKLGWMVSSEYRQVAEDSVRKEVVKPLGEFGIHIPDEMLAKILS